MLANTHKNIAQKGSSAPNIDRLIATLTLSWFRLTPNGFKRFKKNLIEDFKVFEHERRRLNSGQIRKAIDRLYKLANKAEGRFIFVVNRKSGAGQSNVYGKSYITFVKLAEEVSDI